MQKHTIGTIDYYTYGDQPRLLLTSGMHGDERESASIFEAWVHKHLEHLPPLVYVPVVSPSAVRLGTRINAHGHDINRQFTDTTQDAEALAFMRIVKGYAFDLGLDLHEDRDRKKSFYMYDTGKMEESELSAFRAHMRQNGIPLYTGIDDPDDDTLDCMITDGYYSLEADDDDASDGFSNIWLTMHGIVRRKFTLENPQHAEPAEKLHIIDSIVPYLIARYIVK